MKLSALLAFVLFCPALVLAGPISTSTWDGGNIIFATATVGGKAAYTVAEKQALIANQGGYIWWVKPNFFEVALSTTMDRFKDYDEFKNLLTSQSEILEKCQELKTTFLSNEALATDYPEYATILNNKNKKIKARIDLLRAIAGGL